MAFDRNGSAPGAKSNDDNWKAKGFINLYLPDPTTQSGRRKVGAIPLKLANPAERALAEKLEAADEATMQRFVNALQVEYNSAEMDPKAGFVF